MIVLSLLLRSSLPPSILRPPLSMTQMHTECVSRQQRERIKAAGSRHLTYVGAQVLAVVLQRLLDQNAVPELYMRTVLLALKASPTLTDFVMGILQRLISKQVCFDIRFYLLSHILSPALVPSSSSRKPQRGLRLQVMSSAAASLSYFQLYGHD